MPVLFSYCLRYDNGAAPNPFWGVCTLVVCKPPIRREAKVGDWIVGTGSKNSPIGDISGQIVYVMQVTQKMAMCRYDQYSHKHLPNKIPKWDSDDPRLMVGDAIYDFSTEPPRVRESVHGEHDRDRDLGGKYALLSEHFYYFGDQPVPLPDYLRDIVNQGQGRRSCANDAYLRPFLAWLESLGLEPNRLYGKPQGELFQNRTPNWGSRSGCTSATSPGCAARRRPRASCGAGTRPAGYAGMEWAASHEGEGIGARPS